MLPYFSVFDNLAYKVDGYNVTLLGQVTRPTLKSDAENVVKRIEGVEHVDNQIEVLPASPNDDRIRRQLYATIYGDPTLQKYAMGVQQPIRIIVKNGNVTLEGTVDNEGDKNAANMRASSVPGTFKVTNNLQVSTASHWPLKSNGLWNGMPNGTGSKELVTSAVVLCGGDLHVGINA
jgi:hyperosmotically inducible protein